MSDEILFGIPNKKPKRHRATKTGLVDRLAALLEIVRNAQPATVRQIFDLASVRGIVTKDEGGYSRVKSTSSRCADRVNFLMDGSSIIPDGSGAPLIEQTLHSFEREGIWNVGVIQGSHYGQRKRAGADSLGANTGAPGYSNGRDRHYRRGPHAVSIHHELDCGAGMGGRPVFGLTATPWAKGMGKSYDDLIIPVSISQLITDGYLSPFRVFAPPAPDLTGVRMTAGEFNEGDLSTAVDKKEIVADVVRTWLEKGDNRPTLCYGVDRKHAQHLQERFLEAGIAGRLRHGAV